MQLQIETFDTHHHISRKTIKETLDSFVQKYSKNYETSGILGYLTLINQNYAHYLNLSPEVGNLGILIRVTPSKKYPVDHAELSLGYSREKVEDSELVKHNAKILVATKTSQDEVIRNWDLNIMVTINKYQNLDNYKLYYSARKPGEKTFEICMNGQQKNLNEQIIAQHNISLGYTEDPIVCADNEGFIEINMKAEQTDEQINLMKDEKSYDVCLPIHMKEPALKKLSIKYEKKLECTIQKTALRKYEYDIKTTGLSKEFMKHYYNNKFLKGMLFPYYSYEKVTNPVDENSMKVVINYPINANEVNMNIMTKTVSHKISSMPIPLGFFPENYHFSNAAMNWDEMETCLLEDRHIFNDNNELFEMIDGEWMKVIHSNSQGSSNNSILVFVMKMDANNQYVSEI